jgi:integrase
MAADYEQVFARLRAGEKLSPEQIKAAVTRDADQRLLNLITTRFGGLGVSTKPMDNPFKTVSTPEGEYPLEAHSPASLLAKVLVALGRDNAGPLAEAPGIETISQAADAWFTEMQRTDIRAATLEGHKLRVQAFIDHAGDVALAGVTRAQASDWLTKVAQGRSNRTVNNYSVSMRALFDSAKTRGRFQGENPFTGQRRKVSGESYSGFTPAEVNTLLAALPVEITPTKHTPETALPWITLIGAYTGARLEEIAQLTVADIKTLGANGSTVTVFDIHNKHRLKNESSARAIPLHSAIVRAGLLDYAKALPQGSALFPGLKRRASKGGKVGARIGELFRKRLIAMGMKRPGICFHSLRHSVAERLEVAAVTQTDAARVLGHTITGESFGTCSSGPGLKRLAAVVEEISY